MLDKLPAALAAALLFTAVLAGAALAQDAAETAVSVPFGDWIAGAVRFIGETILLALGAVMTVVIAKLPSGIAAFVQSQRTEAVEQLLGKAIQFGINAVEGAAKGKTLDVQVGNAVIREALRFAVDKGPEKLIDWLGGEAKIREMIFARLDLAPEASTATVDLLR